MAAVPEADLVRRGHKRPMLLAVAEVAAVAVEAAVAEVAGATPQVNPQVKAVKVGPVEVHR